MNKENKMIRSVLVMMIFSGLTNVMADESVITKYGKELDGIISKHIQDNPNFKPAIDATVVISIMAGASMLNPNYKEPVPKNKKADNYGRGLCALTVTGAKKNIGDKITEKHLADRSVHLEICFLWLDTLAKKTNINLLTPKTLPTEELKHRLTQMEELATAFFGRNQRDKIARTQTAYLFTLMVYRLATY